MYFERELPTAQTWGHTKQHQQQQYEFTFPAIYYDENLRPAKFYRKDDKKSANLKINLSIRYVQDW